MAEFLDTYPWALPFIIFFGRLCDVPLSTLRIMFVARGDRKLAPLVGFGEIFLWIIIISQVISRADGIISYLCYAAGFAAGTYIGIIMEEKLAIGFYKYQIFMKRSGVKLLQIFNKHNFGATLFHGEGFESPSTMVETIIHRKQKNVLEDIIHKYDPEAFVIVEPIKEKAFGIFSVRKRFVPDKHDASCL